MDQTIILDTENVKLSPLEAFIKQEQVHIKRNLSIYMREFKPRLRKDPDCYRESRDDEPTIDIRLCIDASPGPDSFEWIFRTGDSSYDQRHSRYCGAGCIGIGTKVDDLLLELIDQVLEQEATSGPL